MHKPNRVIYKQSEREIRSAVHMCSLRWGSNHEKLIEKFRKDNEGRPERPINQ